MVVVASLSSKRTEGFSVVVVVVVVTELSGLMV